MQSKYTVRYKYTVHISLQTIYLYTYTALPFIYV